MPHFTFELHIILVKMGEQPIHMTRRTLDVYMSIHVQLAYNMAKSYIDQGWMIERIELKDFIFLSDINLTWGD